MKALLIGLAASGLALGLHAFGWPLASVELALYDRAMRWSARNVSASHEVVLAAIDSRSLQAVGSWPWPRERHARAIDAMTRDGARAIYMDVGIFDPDRSDPANDRRLIQSTAASGKVVYPMVFHEVDGKAGTRVAPLEPLPEVAAAAAAIAHAHLEPGPDGVVRSVHLAYRTDERTYWGPSVELLRLFFGLSPDAVVSPRPGVVRLGDVDVPVQEGELEKEAPIEPPAPGAPRMEHGLRISFFGAAGTFDRVSAVDVIEGRSPSRFFENKIVLYGMTATGLGAGHATPMSSVAPMPGVELQANVAATILRRRFLRPVGPTLAVLASIIACVAVAWGYGRYGVSGGFWLLLCGLGGTLAAYAGLFVGLGYCLEVTPILAGISMSFIGSALAYGRQRALVSDSRKD